MKIYVVLKQGNIFASFFQFQEAKFYIVSTWLKGHEVGLQNLNPWLWDTGEKNDRGDPIYASIECIEPKGKCTRWGSNDDLILNILHEIQPATRGEISSHCDLGYTTIYDCLKRLENLGKVKRESKTPRVVVWSVLS